MSKARVTSIIRRAGLSELLALHRTRTVIKANVINDEIIDTTIHKYIIN